MVGLRIQSLEYGTLRLRTPLPDGDFLQLVIGCSALLIAQNGVGTEDPPEPARSMQIAKVMVWTVQFNGLAERSSSLV